MVATLEHKTFGEKNPEQLIKDAACSFEDILEEANHETQIVMPLASNLARHHQKTS